MVVNDLIEVRHFVTHRLGNPIKKLDSSSDTRNKFQRIRSSRQMAINKNQTGLNFINLFLPALVFVFSGCAGPKIAADLLAKAKTNETPLKEGTYILNVSINPQINNSERIDESVKQSIDIALAKANIFGADTSKPHRIDANIKRASQAPMSFSSFEGRLEIIYTVTDFTG
jgi:hypothetical protein